MANIYVHYPFCKKACHYCNFHFSTKLNNQTIVLDAILKEIEIRSNEINDSLESIYFGGGSPSILETKYLEKIINKILSQFKVKKKIEITLELNPDDYSKEYLVEIKKFGINRISLGVQSFNQFDLELLNRNHNSVQSLEALDCISNLYDNYSIDLIYGIPYSSIEKWRKNLEITLKYQPPHLSCYVLTLESNTALEYKVKNGDIELLEEELVKEQYDYLIQKLGKRGYVNYEFSSFAKPGYNSINNSNYWNGKAYIGIGPSAHSYNGKSIRSWNISNNSKYVKSIMKNRLPAKMEKLKINDLYNEYIMTGLRKEEGISFNEIKNRFGETYKKYIEKQLKKHIINKHIFLDGDTIKISKKFKFLTDGLSSDLFFLRD